MRAVVQRVNRAEVRIEGRSIAQIGAGLLVLAGFGQTDTAETVARIAEKILNLRIFGSGAGKMSLSLLEICGELLCVPQFTLYGDARHGRRPSFTDAAPPADAEPLYESFLGSLGALGAARGIKIASGQFQANMQVELVNDGPVTLLLDSGGLF